MKQISPIVTNSDVWAAFEQMDLDQPVGMLNLLKFRASADYDPHHKETPCTGEEAYDRYSGFVWPLLHAKNARVILTGALWMIGQTDEWDRSFVVRWEHARDILSLGSDPDYNKVVHHRTAALIDSRLLMMTFDQ